MATSNSSKNKSKKKVQKEVEKAEEIALELKECAELICEADMRMQNTDAAAWKLRSGSY